MNSLASPNYVENIYSISSDIGKIVWHEFGVGKPIILLHGGSGSWKHWIRTVDHLSNKAKIFTPDMPGFGDSPCFDEPVTNERFLALLALWIEHVVGETPFILGGFSLGAKVAVQLARQFGPQVTKLLLVGGSFMATSAAGPDYERFDKTTPLDERRRIERANLVKVMFAREESADALAQDIQRANLAKRSLPRSRVEGQPAMQRDLPHVVAAVDAAFGAEDWLIGDKDAQRRALAELCPGATLTFIPDAGHWVMYEAPDAFNRWIQSSVAAV